MSSISSSISTISSMSFINKHKEKLDQTHQRLATGDKTAISYEDPTAVAKIGALKTDAKAYTTLVTDLNDKYTMLGVASNGIAAQQNKNLDIRNIIQKSKSNIVTEEEKSKLTKEVQLLVQDFDVTANKVTYNNLQLLSGNLSNTKLNTSINGYENIKLQIPSSDTSKVINTRFETGANISKSAEVSLEFGLENNQTVKLPSAIISHSTGTGIGQLAQIINDNHHSLGFNASYNVSTAGKTAISFGTIKNININDIDIGTVQMNSEADYVKLKDLINKKTSETGVEASIVNEKIVLDSSSGRGIAIKASFGMGLLNIERDGATNYGKLTLINYDGHTSNILNDDEIGFNKLTSKIIPLDYFAQGRFSVEDKKAIGVKDADIYNNQKLDFNNKIYTGRLLGIIDKVSSNLESTREHIAYVQQKILNQKNMADDDKRATNTSISNLQDIDYAKEVFNQKKFQNLKESALYAFNKALSFDKTVHDILLKNLQD